LALLLLLLTLPAVAQVTRDFLYVTNENTITIMAYIGFGGAASIPSSINGLPVTGIADRAFTYAAGVTNVAIPNTVTSIGNNAFQGCIDLVAFIVDALNPVYSSVDGVLFDKSQTTLILCPEATFGNYIIPNSVTSIGYSAFSYCALASITIGNSVGSIGAYAFSFSPNLSSVYFTGHAPTPSLLAFVGSNSTIYYLPGTAGWGTNFAGVPTTVWLPQVQTSDTSFGLQTNQFGFNIEWASGMTVVVEASRSLVNPIWSPISTNTLTSGSLYFTDPYWSNYPSRFYRVTWP
jgi:hypothetical protein